MRISPSASLLGLALCAGLLGSCSADGSGSSVLEQAFPPPAPGRFAYALHAGDGTLASFVVEAGTGRLRPQAYFAFESFDVAPGAAAVTPEQDALFLTEDVTQTISVLRADPTTGVLERKSFQPGLGLGPHDVVVHPREGFVYTSALAAGQVVAFHWIPDEDRLEELEELGPYDTAFNGPSKLLMDPRGDFLFVVHGQNGGVQTYRIGPNGRLDQGGFTTSLAPSQLGDAVIDNSGLNIYMSLKSFDSVVRLEIDGDARILVRESISTKRISSEVARPGALALHPLGNFLYVLNEGTGTIARFVVDRGTAQLRELSVLGPSAGASRIVFEPAGSAAYLLAPERNALLRYRWELATGGLDFREEIRTRTGLAELVFLQGEDGARLLPKALYVANRGSNQVEAYEVSAADGALSALGAPVAAGDEPVALAIGRTRPFAFAANAGSGDVSRYAVAPSGALSELLPRIPVEGQPTAIALEPSDRFLYVASSGTSSLRAFALLEEGLLLPLGDPIQVADDPLALAVDPSGRFLHLACADLAGGGAGGSVLAFEIDVATGQLGLAIPGGIAPGGPLALSFVPGGTRLYAAQFGDGSVLSFDVSTTDGSLAQITPATPGLRSPRALAISPTSRFAFVAARDGLDPGWLFGFDLRPSDGALYDAASGELEPRQSLAIGSTPSALAIDPSERFLWVADEGSSTVERFDLDPTGTAAAGAILPVGGAPSALLLSTRVE